MSAALELRAVRAGYGRVQVLDEVSVKVPAGHVVALLGPNGAGKTTLLRVAAGLLRPSAGQVWLDGRDVTAHSVVRRVRAGLILVPEGRGVFPGLTVAQNLRLAAEATGGDTAPALGAFPRLAERLGQRAATLSGGEQQMLALARGLLSGARVLLLDEISMGLAPQVVEELFEVVAQLRAQGISVLLVEQYLSYALRLADVGYLLARGRVVFVGEPGEFRSGSVAAGYLAGNSPVTERG